ncbi:hypothetical protein CHUAL_012537 [Chamberlinius hualienensis]
MPVTTRYSASLDRTYEDGEEMTQQLRSTASPVSPPIRQQSEWENDDIGQRIEEGLSDSMDSLGLDDDSNSSTSGHSRQHSSDGGSSTSPAYATRTLAAISPKPPAFNPLQFVKTAASPLLKKAEAQMKQYEEVKKVKELVKEDEEEWQSNLDVWKNRRRLVSQKTVQRVEESKQIEEEVDKKRRKSKTFSEMMEERSRRGSTKALPPVYSSDDWSSVTPPLASEEELDDHRSNGDSNGSIGQNGKNVSEHSNGHTTEVKDETLSVFDEAIRSYVEYAEETIIKTKLQSNNDNESYDSKDVETDVVDSAAATQTQSTDELFTKELLKVNNDQVEELSREPGTKLSLSLHLRRQSEQNKDFGFTVKSVKGLGTGSFVETVQPQSPAAVAGLRVNDELLEINSEQCTSDRNHSAIVFAIKQAVYTGQLYLTIYRYDNPEIVIQSVNSVEVKEVDNSGIEGSGFKVDVSKRRSLFERAMSPERVATNRRSLDLSYSLKDKVASFEGNYSKAKSTEVLNTRQIEQLTPNKMDESDCNPQVGSGLKCGFELASTLQETPIINSAPNSPSLEPEIDLDFDIAKEEILVVVDENSVIQNGKIPEPPKEKPPPPPPVPECDPSADPSYNKTVKLRRVESTKRIRNEISKRRSNFLGIEDDQFQRELEQEMSQVSPPPNVDEMFLKMEKELMSGIGETQHEIESESSLLSPTSSSSVIVDDEDIDQKEREIIESLEKWEEEPKLAVSGVDVCEATLVVSNVPEASKAVKMVLGVTDEIPVVRNDKVLEEKENLLKLQEERLRSEKEKLRREQEELMRKKEEYEKRIHLIQQQQIQLQTTAVQVGFPIDQLPVTAPKTKSQVATAENHNHRPTTARGPPPPIMTKPKLNEGSSTDEDLPSQPQFLPQSSTKPNAVAISAPPKAKLMDGEEWMQRRKRENYHQHWLVQEAEFRRLQAASQNRDNEPLSPPSLADDRLKYQQPSSPSKHHVADTDISSRQLSPLRQPSVPSNGLSEGKTPGQLQKSIAPRPPAKPVFNPPPAPSTDRRTSQPLSPKVNTTPLLLTQQSSASTNSDTQILSVSGKKRCSHCGIELGRGAAMIIESLQLFYHIGCFKCCVCHVQLGNGSSGTDVRVRSQKLHCHNCYSNDEGLKFSKV